MLLRLGDSGDTVRELQLLLNSHYIKTDVDGLFGPLTKEAVKKFQTRLGLSADGVVGPVTWAALNNSVHPDTPLNVVLGGFAAVGMVWTLGDFKQWVSNGCKYRTNQNFNTRPFDGCRAVCLHHTASPSLKMRPNGLTKQHIINIRDYYKKLGWSSGPHFFADDYAISGMTPISKRGVHAKSFNGLAIGIEVLGDYDSESPTTGRGLVCWQNAATATAALLKFLNKSVSNTTVLFHREDPLTDKTCPGSKVKKQWVLDLIRAAS